MFSAVLVCHRASALRSQAFRSDEGRLFEVGLSRSASSDAPTLAPTRPVRGGPNKKGTANSSTPPAREAKTSSGLLHGLPKTVDTRWVLFGEKGNFKAAQEDKHVWRLADKDSQTIGKFQADAIGTGPAKLLLNSDSNGRYKMQLTVHMGEIMKDVQDPANADAMFVLPSQFNGAEYPMPTHVVRELDDYRRDNTGGPRGQLAGHPAAAQFIVNYASINAKSDPTMLGGSSGITSLDRFLNPPDAVNSVFHRTNDTKKAIWLHNGYLVLPVGLSAAEKKEIMSKVDKYWKEVRILATSGLTVKGGVRAGPPPLDQKWCKIKHNVTLVYASAVPLQQYTNMPKVAADIDFHRKIGKAMLVIQYYGAMALARKLGQTKVFFMPLGGGVFNNRKEDIADAIISAMQMFEKSNIQDALAMDLRVLAFEGNGEGHIFKDLLKKVVGKGPPKETALGKGVAKGKAAKEQKEAKEKEKPAAKGKAKGKGAGEDKAKGKQEENTKDKADDKPFTRRRKVDAKKGKKAVEGEKKYEVKKKEEGDKKKRKMRSGASRKSTEETNSKDRSKSADRHRNKKDKSKDDSAKPEHLVEIAKKTVADLSKSFGLPAIPTFEKGRRLTVAAVVAALPALGGGKTQDAEVAPRQASLAQLRVKPAHVGARGDARSRAAAHGGVGKAANAMVSAGITAGGAVQAPPHLY